ncbi:unnamed protein product [Mytilus edulis]|uniref:Core-binding (CB) domain-containing protein n=1 Tax=Mytilus edulis TaxID=6550 RepID=A0A8S3SM27_MYTED|nr:unnamed protein product [Mytilus edulis]
MGWGAYLEGRTASGLWSGAQLEEHINLLEMRAVFLSLRQFQAVIQGQSLLVATDNSTVVAYLQNQGGTHSFSLYHLSKEILLLCHSLNIFLSVRHVPGSQNLLADALSRSRVPVNTEWEIHPSVFQEIILRWDRPHIDLFATSLNHKLETYVSPIPDEKAWAEENCIKVWRISICTLGCCQDSLRKGGFSEGATKRISGSVRQSTGAVYDSKWSIFCTWCLSKQINPLSVTVQQLADFFLYLFEEKGYSPSTIKGYRSAIARTISLSGGSDFGDNEFLSLLIKNFCLNRPRQRRLVPSWDLGLVLKVLQFSPFEPLHSASFKFLSYKCCFLIALATGRRRSEIHALSISESCLRFASDKSSVTLLTDPSFLAKNQLPDKGSGIITIPALPPTSDNQVLCPVRALLVYLASSAKLRSAGSSRLFIPIKKGISDISAKTISTWICNTVILAYKSASSEVLVKHQVKA